MQLHICRESVAPRHHKLAALFTRGCADTRSFGTPVADLAGMLEPVAAYATRVGEKLRLHGLEATHIARIHAHVPVQSAKSIALSPN